MFDTLTRLKRHYTFVLLEPIKVSGDKWNCSIRTDSKELDAETTVLICQQPTPELAIYEGIAAALEAMSKTWLICFVSTYQVVEDHASVFRRTDLNQREYESFPSPPYPTYEQTCKIMDRIKKHSVRFCTLSDTEFKSLTADSANVRIQLNIQAFKPLLDDFDIMNFADTVVILVKPVGQTLRGDFTDRWTYETEVVNQKGNVRKLTDTYQYSSEARAALGGFFKIQHFIPHKRRVVIFTASTTATSVLNRTDLLSISRAGSFTLSESKINLKPVWNIEAITLPQELIAELYSKLDGV